jgi:hypothetical protein
VSAFWLNQALGYPPGATRRRIQTLRRHRWQSHARNAQTSPGAPRRHPTGAPQRSLMDLTAAREAIAAADWRSSKGYESHGLAVAPHAYIVRQKQPEPFAVLAQAIKDSPDAYTQKYGRTTYRYLEIDGFRSEREPRLMEVAGAA